MLLDERLSLAAALYQPCEWGADIGTDHALLPCHLLREGICRHMIAADVSAKALIHARENLTRHHLLDRAEIVQADGLDAVTRPCGCISMMGMGGETMADILRRGRDKLHGAVLVLGAHTELHRVRGAIMDADYHITQERLCRAGGRFYVLWRAEAGAEALTPEEYRYGKHLWQGDGTLLREYAAWRMRVHQERLNGLLAAAHPREDALNEARADVAWYRSKQEEFTC